MKFFMDALLIWHIIGKVGIIDNLKGRIITNNKESHNICMIYDSHNAMTGEALM